MTKILAVTNQKGGVGKTTTTVNLAASLAAAKQRVLLIDLDPQGNATMGSGIDKRDLLASVYEVLLGSKSIVEARIYADAGKYDLLPANRDLAGAEIELVELPQRETRLREALQLVEGEYDFVLIDCPPALNLLTLNGLCAAKSVMIPMQCEYYALEGLSDLVNTIRKVRTSLNPVLEIDVCCGPCLIPAMRSRNRFRTSCWSISATRSTALSFRAMCVWQKRPVMECQCCTTTSYQKERKHIWPWQENY